MELGCGEGGTSRRAVWRPGALRAFSLQHGPGSREAAGPSTQAGQRRARGGESEESSLGMALHFRWGNGSRDFQQSTVYSMSVSVLQVFSTHEVCRHNITHPQHTERTKKETSV